MIREWRITRFKSIAATEVLPFRPLTILAGPNSSGKSSVIQSILLIAQSLASQVPERQLVLNGELVKLGTFDDVHNQQSTERAIGFGFTVDLELERRLLTPAARARQWSVQWFRAYGPEVPAMTVSGDISFGPATEHAAEGISRPLQADVLRASFKTSIRDRQAALFPVEPQDSAEPDVSLERRSDTEVEQVLTTLGTRSQAQESSALRQALRYAIHFSPRARKSLNQRRVELPLPEAAGELIAARLHHFLPSGVLWRQRELARTLETVLRRVAVGKGQEVSATLDAWAASTDPIRSALVRAIKDAAVAAGVDVPKFVRDLRGPRANVDELQALVARADLAVDEAWRNAMSLVSGPLPEEQELAFQGLHEFFGSIRYLGPLRDDPKPVYTMPGSLDPTDVGSKGQYTAAVLDVNSTMLVEFIPPGSRGIVRARLGEALREWLRHFAMAESVQTIDEGKLGHRLLVRPTGIRSEVDLTNVGVGVSQVLPILVMALVSEPGAVLLFEQPELHLHPAVQSQLADFFIALVRSGRQCLVETHSEYLINRLRLRIAESERDDDLKESAIIHFVERTGATSKFTAVAINEYGAIPAWPTGFFDQSPNESDEILKAAMRKKAGRRTS